MAKRIDRLERLRRLIEEKHNIEVAKGHTILFEDKDEWNKYRSVERAIERNMFAVPKFVHQKIKSWYYDPRFCGGDFQEYLEKEMKRKDLAAMVRKDPAELSDIETALLPELRSAKEDYKKWQKEKLKEHAKLKNDRIEEFRRDLEKEYGTENWPKRDLLWNEVYTPCVSANASHTLEGIHAHYGRILLLLIKFGAM